MAAGSRGQPCPASAAHTSTLTMDLRWMHSERSVCKAARARMPEGTRAEPVLPRQHTSAQLVLGVAALAGTRSETLSVFKFTRDAMDRNRGIEPGHLALAKERMPRFSSSRMTMTSGLPILGSLMVCHLKNATSSSPDSTSRMRRIIAEAFELHRVQRRDIL